MQKYREFLQMVEKHSAFVKYCNKEGMPPLGKLPSTSPANAAWNLERLTAGMENGIWNVFRNNRIEDEEQHRKGINLKKEEMTNMVSCLRQWES